MTTSVDAFSTDYFTSRGLFHDAASAAGLPVQSYTVDSPGPSDEELTIDVAHWAPDSAKHTVVVSSGLHGVEGPFGSTVQRKLLKDWTQLCPDDIRVLFIHSINPYGFVWHRRFNEKNVDLNRNFLLTDETFSGCHPVYHELDPLLNPESAPNLFPPLVIEAIPALLRIGTETMGQAIAGGQYDYPRGLFFGGNEPASSQRRLKEILLDSLQGIESVTHIDFHTGLGKFGSGVLLLDGLLTQPQREWMQRTFGDKTFSEPSERDAYRARGSFGRWCRETFPNIDYLYTCAEFGTFGTAKMLTGLRAENRAHHWGNSLPPGKCPYKRKLLSLFCPEKRNWRRQVVDAGCDWVERCLRSKF